MAKILVKFPTRGRRKVFIQTLAQWLKMLSGKHDVHFLVTVDEDDAEMNDRAILDKLTLLKQASVRFHVGQGTGSKVEAINRGIIEAIDGAGADIVILAADDFIPQEIGYEDQIAQEFANRGATHMVALWYEDGWQQKQTGEPDKICTMPILSAGLVKKWGYIYHPSYRAVFCDNEYTDVLTMGCVLHRMNKCLIRHEWQLSDHDGKPDATKSQNETRANYDQDSATYHKRKADGFPGSGLGMEALATGEVRDHRESFANSVITINAVEAEKPSSEVDALDTLISQGPQVQRYAAAPSGPVKPPDQANVLNPSILSPRLSVILERGGNQKAHAAACELFLKKAEENQIEVIEGSGRRTLIEKTTGTYVVLIPTERWAIHMEYANYVMPQLAGNPDVVCVPGEGILQFSNGKPQKGVVAKPNMAVNIPVNSFIHFSVEFRFPSRKENGSLPVEYSMYPTFLCPIKRRLLMQAIEKVGDIVKDAEFPGDEGDLRHWGECLSMSGVLAFPDKETMQQKQRSLDLCCYGRIA